MTDDTPHEPELGPDSISDAGLEIMEGHLREAYERIGRAADRTEDVDLNNIRDGHNYPSFKMAGAAAQLWETIQQVQDERERREGGQDE